MQANESKEAKEPRMSIRNWLQMKYESTERIDKRHGSGSIAHAQNVSIENRIAARAAKSPVKPVKAGKAKSSSDRAQAHQQRRAALRNSARLTGSIASFLKIVAGVIGRPDAA